MLREPGKHGGPFGGSADPEATCTKKDRRPIPILVGQTDTETITVGLESMTP